MIFHVPFSAPSYLTLRGSAGEYGTVMYEAGPPEKHECGGSRARGVERVERVGARGEGKRRRCSQAAFLPLRRGVSLADAGLSVRGGVRGGDSGEPKEGLVLLYGTVYFNFVGAWLRCRDMSKTHYINILILYAICDHDIPGSIAPS